MENNPPLPPKENWEEEMSLGIEFDDQRLYAYRGHNDLLRKKISALLQKEKEEAYIHGIESVTSCRCRNHLKVPLLNTNEFGGAECGACVESQARSTALEEAKEAIGKLKRWVCTIREYDKGDKGSYGDEYVVRDKELKDALSSLHALKKKK